MIIRCFIGDREVRVGRSVLTDGHLGYFAVWMDEDGKSPRHVGLGADESDAVDDLIDLTEEG